MCAEGPGEKHLQTQFINKSLPAPDTDPVRIYIDITYSFTECPSPRPGCNVELHIENRPKSFSFGENVIMPDNHIQSTSDASNGTKEFNFISSNLSTGFNLTLISHEGCVTVSRVLVYRYECPGHDRQPTVDLGRRPATQAPISAFVSVTSYCAENSNFTGRPAVRMLVCSSSGLWSGAPLPCQCNVGYSRNGNICEGKNLTASQFQNRMSIFLAEGQVSSDVTQLSATSSFTVSPSVLPSPEGSSGGPLIGILSGVAAVIVVFLFLVIVLVITFVRNKRKSKPNDPDTTENVGYETTVTLSVIPTVHNQAYETCFDDHVYAGGGPLAVKSTGTNNRFESLHSLS